jgi:phage gpG-like protein
MPQPLTIHFDGAAVTRAFAALSARARDLSPLMADIAEHLVESTQRRFQSGVGPDGVPWPALRDGSGRTPLTATGTLRDQIFPSHGSHFAEITASSRQARFHQEGTRPYTILPRDRKALAWPGGRHPVARVHHPGLPARPFLGVGEEDARAILALAEQYLAEAVGGA